jgi:abequosyltransferase
MGIRLTFCIPTLNFGSFIAETLFSIIDQADDRVDIVIVDGGSTDDTADVVQRVAQTFPRITFFQRRERVGVDRDILESVALATGDFCWLFSSDDLLGPGALRAVLAAIEAGGWDLLLTGVTLCDLTMAPLAPHRYLDCDNAQTFDWTKPHKRADYFRRARTTTAFCSFISGVVVDRQRWMNASGTEHFVGSCWIIAAKAFAMDQQGLRLRYEPGVTVLKRGDNDSFMAHGITKRIALSICGFRDLAIHFYGKGSAEYAAISRVVSNEYPLLGMLNWKRQVRKTGSAKEMADFYGVARRHYDNNSITDRLFFCILRYAPIWLLDYLYRSLVVFRALRSRWKNT